MLTKELVRDYFNYDNHSGLLYWKDNVPLKHFQDKRGQTRHNNMFGNKEAGSVTRQGYKRVQLQGKPYAVHRLIWLWVYGKLPEDQIDHIDGNKINNRIGNLRDVDNITNAQNQKRPKNNTSGHIGVSKTKYGKWKVAISVDGKQIHLGNFEDFDEACNIRKGAEIMCKYHKNHGRI